MFLRAHIREQNLHFLLHTYTAYKETYKNKIYNLLISKLTYKTYVMRARPHVEINGIIYLVAFEFVVHAKKWRNRRNRRYNVVFIDIFLTTKRNKNVTDVTVLIFNGFL